MYPSSFKNNFIFLKTILRKRTKRLYSKGRITHRTHSPRSIETNRRGVADIYQVPNKSQILRQALPY